MWLPLSATFLLLVGCAGGRPLPGGAERPALSSDFAGESAPAAEMRLAKDAGSPAAPVAREIIRRGALTLEVENLAAAEAATASWVKNVGGFVEGTQSSNLNSVRAIVSMTLRVPVKQFEAAMGHLETLGLATSKSIASEDVTTQLTDLRARLRVLRAQEETLLRFLGESKTIKDSLAVNAELSRVRGEIESMDAIRRTQEELASLSTIVVTFQSPAQLVARRDSQGWAQDAWTGSLNALLGQFRVLGEALIGVAVFFPLWGPVLGVVWWLRRRALARRQRTAESALKG